MQGKLNTREKRHEEENQEIFKKQQMGDYGHSCCNDVVVVFLHGVWFYVGNSAVPHGHENNSRLRRSLHILYKNAGKGGKNEKRRDDNGTK